MTIIKLHTDLVVYKKSFAAAMEIFELTKNFPKEERFSLTDQIRRSSRSVSANIAEGWRKRRYEKAFVLKFTDADGEVAETQNWLHFSRDCGYVASEIVEKLYDEYNEIAAILNSMIFNSKKWTF